MKVKKIVAGMLVPVLTLSANIMPIMATEINVSAYTESRASSDTNGKCGENLTWELSANGTLTISGTGNMYDYTEQLKCTYNTEKINSVIIEDGVTSIGRMAFYGCKTLENVTMADSMMPLLMLR